MAQILVMEDDPDFGSILLEVLEADGHEATLCVSATQAQAHIERSKYDLLITDLLVYQDQKPVADGGISLITWLRGATNYKRDPWMRKMPIIAISGAIHNQGMSKLLGISETVGADRTLAKPADLHELLNAIEELLLTNESQSKTA